MNVVIKLHCGPQDLDEYYHLIIGIAIPSTQLSSASTLFLARCECVTVHLYIRVGCGVCVHGVHSSSASFRNFMYLYLIVVVQIIYATSVY